MGVKPAEETMIRREDPRGRPYFWMTGGCVPTGDLHPRIDQVALAEGYITITPLKFDLTDSARIDEVASWNLRLPK